MASDALLRLGRELDDLARTSQAGEAVPHLGPVPLGPLLATVAEEWRALADVRGIALRVHPTGACAATDATMLATILRNLVGNAVKYGRTGGRVVIGCRRRGRRLAIEVHDDGAGIASERLATIFEAFDRAGRRDGAGLGLGLHIVRQTAQALRAPVRVASVLGRGTVFGVTLPRAEPGPKMRTTPKQISQKWPPVLRKKSATKQGSERTKRWPANASLMRPEITTGAGPRVAALAIALAVFLFDVLSPIEGAVAVLYVVVVLIAARAFSRRGVVLTAVGCLALTATAYLISHGPNETGAPLLRCLVSLAATGIATALALRHKADAAILAEQARLLDLTHDAVFVRDAREVITFWNPAAEALYGWSAAEAVGCVAHDLLRTRFPAEKGAILAELHRTGRWEGTLVQHVSTGGTITLESRWALQRDAAGAPLAVLETNTDVTERERTHARLVASERRYRSIFDNTQVSILQQDWSAVQAELDRLRADGVADLAARAADPAFAARARRRVALVDVNAATLRMLRATDRESLIGPLADLLPETDQSFPKALAALASGARTFEGEAQMRARDGTLVPVLFGIRFRPIRPSSTRCSSTPSTSPTARRRRPRSSPCRPTSPTPPASPRWASSPPPWRTRSTSRWPPW